MRPQSLSQIERQLPCVDYLSITISYHAFQFVAGSCNRMDKFLAQASTHAKDIRETPNWVPLGKIQHKIKQK